MPVQLTCVRRDRREERTEVKAFAKAQTLHAARSPTGANVVEGGTLRFLLASRAQCADWNGLLAWRVFLFLFLMETLEKLQATVDILQHKAKVATGGTACLFPTLCRHKADIHGIRPCHACVCIIYERSKVRFRGGGRALWRWLKKVSKEQSEIMKIVSGASRETQNACS